MSLFVKEKSFYRQYGMLTFIIALQNVIAFAVNLADNVMLGVYGESALSGAALANQVQFLLQMLTMGVGEGVVVLCSQYWGKNDRESIRKIIGCALWVGLFFSSVLFITVYFFPAQTIGLFTSDPEVIAEGVGYITIVCFSYIFFCLTNILLASMRSVETVRIGVIVSLVALLINIVLNYAFIFGNFGAPEMGAPGAALATVIAWVSEFVIVAIYVLVVDKKIKFRISYFLKIESFIFRDYLKVGWPVMLSNAIWAIGNSGQMVILGRLGSEAIAANSIASTIFQILTVVIYGSASASSVMTGKAVGMGEIDRVKANTKTFQILFLMLGAITSLGLMSSKGMILGFYQISDEATMLAGQFINVLSITVIGTAYQASCLTGIVRGGGDTRFVLYNDLIFVYCVVLPISALAAFVLRLSPVFVFFCLKSDQILKCFVAVVKVNRFKWIKKLTR